MCMTDTPPPAPENPEDLWELVIGETRASVPASSADFRGQVRSLIGASFVQ